MRKIMITLMRNLKFNFVLLFLFLLCSSSLQAQTTTGNLTAASASCSVIQDTAHVVFPAYQGTSQVSIQVTGFGSATLQLEFSPDNGTTCYTLPTTNVNTGANGITSITANAYLVAPNFAFTHIIVRASAYTSGTIAVAIRAFAVPNLLTVNSLALTADPCGNPNIVKSVIAVTATGQQVALVAGQNIYVCGFAASMGGTGPTAQFQIGTGANCGTGTASTSGALAPAPNGTMLVLGYGGTYISKTASAGQAWCVTLAGTSPTIAGTMSYVQQ
jgi:hypothetical protein